MSKSESFHDRIKVSPEVQAAINQVIANHAKQEPGKKNNHTTTDDGGRDISDSRYGRESGYKYGKQSNTQSAKQSNTQGGKQSNTQGAKAAALQSAKAASGGEKGGRGTSASTGGASKGFVLNKAAN